MRGVFIDEPLEKTYLTLSENLTYVDNGRTAGPIETKEEPPVNTKADVILIKPLKKTGHSTGSFLAVDCATRMLKRANNLGYTPCVLHTQS